MSRPKKLSLGKIKKLLMLFRYIVSQKSGNKSIALKYLDDESIDSISESIFNLLYNEQLNLIFSKPQKRNLQRVIKHNVQSFEDISKKKPPIRKKRTKIIQTVVLLQPFF